MHNISRPGSVSPAWRGGLEVARARGPGAGDNMPNKHRHGKITDGGHSTSLQGLKGFLKRFEDWDEVQVIILGPVSRRTSGSGDLKFRATRWALAGDGAPSGLKCEATRGSMAQTVIITSTKPGALKRRLQSAGYVNW